MSGEREETLLLAGEYVLGVLDARQEEEVEHRLASDRELRAGVAEWRNRLAELDELAPAVTPSVALWPAIERAIATPATVSSQPKRGLWTSLAFWRATAFAALAACLALSIGLLVQEQRPQPLVIAVLEAQDSSPAIIVEAYADGSLRVVPLAALTLPEGRALQVWTVQDSAAGPVPLGVLAGMQRAVLRTGAPARPQQFFAISLEPAGGSPTGKPTGPILYQGNAATPR